MAARRIEGSNEVSEENPFANLIQADKKVQRSQAAPPATRKQRVRRKRLVDPDSREVQVTHRIYASVKDKLDSDVEDVNTFITTYLPQLIETSDPDEVWGQFLKIGGLDRLDKLEGTEYAVTLSTRIPLRAKKRLSSDAGQVGTTIETYVQALILVSDPHEVMSRI